MNAPTPIAPRFVPIADHAVLVEFGEVIDDAAHEAVLSLDAALALAPPAGFREAVPAYVNLLIDFDPVETDHARVTAAVRGLIGQRARPAKETTTREVSVCYEPPFSPDLDSVAQQTGLSAEAVISLHLAGDYRVFLYGFAPGYAYLGGLPPALRIDRKPAPVPGVPAGAVIIAGSQALVTTLTMPSGWWTIGRSPTAILTGNPDRPFLFDVGDRVKFRRIRAEDMTGEKANG